MKGKNSYICNMKVAEKQKLEKIPTGIDTNEILQLVLEGAAEHQMYFRLLKLLSLTEDKEISKWLSISEKTFRSYKISHIKITKRSLAEHTIMLLSLFKHGKEIFGDSEHFTAWLNTANFYFDQKPPIEFLDTVSGIKFIDDRLTGIEFGDNA